MPKRKSRLRASGVLSPAYKVTYKSKWVLDDGASQSSETVDYPLVPVESSIKYKSSGPWVLLTHPAGFLYRWRLPSEYTRGYQIIDLNNTVSTVNWGSPFPGQGQRIGPLQRDLLQTGDFSGILENTSSFIPYVSYNELARNSVAIRMKVKDAKVNLSVFAAEMKKAASGLAKNFSDLIGIYRSVRSGNFAKAASFFKPRPNHRGFSSRDVAGRWLELQYGILPLMGDINSGYEYIRENIETLMTYRVSANLAEDLADRSILLNDEVSIRGRGRRGMRTQVHYVIDSRALKEAASLGLLNPLSVGWELIPYSFVLDWVFPVGTMIEALDAVVGTSFVSGTRTTWCDVDLDGWVKEAYLGDQWYPNDGLTRIPFTGKLFSVHREPLYEYPLVLPYVKNPFSTNHLINAVALVRNLFKR